MAKYPLNLSTLEASRARIEVAIVRIYHAVNNLANAWDQDDIPDSAFATLLAVVNQQVDIIAAHRYRPGLAELINAEHLLAFPAETNWDVHDVMAGIDSSLTSLVTWVTMTKPAYRVGAVNWTQADLPELGALLSAYLANFDTTDFVFPAA